MRQSYPTAEWDIRKPLIMRLYVSEGESLDGVTSRLQQEGFYVNQRMVKTRIKNWNLHKKLRLPEMRTAIQLLVEAGFDETSPQPQFLVHGRLVEYSEVLRYFRRKGIWNPLEWYARLPGDEQPPSADVLLITPCSSNDNSYEASSQGDFSDQSQQGAASMDSALLTTPLPCEITEQLPFRSRDADLQPTYITSEFLHEAHTSIATALQTPLYVTSSRLVNLSHAYCSSYSISSRATQHSEPLVHHLTTHAKFAQHIQDGIALLLRQDNASAFVDFEAAFALVREIVIDSHPMAITLLMSVVCDLDSRRLGLGGLIFALFRHVKETAELEAEAYDPIGPLFDTILRADCDATHLALLLVRRMTDCFAVPEDGTGEVDWKWLYLRERLCDCLYYAGCDHERAKSRKALLHDQQAMYGVGARNVLWTCTNVAHDYLLIGCTNEARSMYGEVLARGSRLEGYGRAKTRFAALEGLGRCKLKEAGCLRSESIETMSDELAVLAEPQIREALHFYREAEAEASVWFERSSRRLVRVRMTISKLEALLN